MIVAITSMNVNPPRRKVAGTLRVPLLFSKTADGTRSVPATGDWFLFLLTRFAQSTIRNNSVGVSHTICFKVPSLSLNFTMIAPLASVG
jgi:hypothetical protein